MTENQRVDACAHALVKSDMPALGNILTEAHKSMRDNMGASTDRLDFLVDTAGLQTGCLGARLVGGGFGGSCFALMPMTDVENFISAMQLAFKNKYDTDLPAYPVESNDAASVWRVYD
ncbi:MAG: hypothetical protein COY19_07475 [Candidatus Marinimicrobia bacterium CG_4_10_14_0_2_um_filter_48_9]|nr:MAG: hypothetical protein COY19_07475 [Candidatus Marinimicrobia bacterium CG_4_10_14_0_2_um_filter_48_9]